ncbi:MAG TPA: hypothetical protein VKP30_07025, partial [Polyangiaceae bacterium]|nr:hypothetical protein [Polyangiaceae bacterium]
MPHQAERILGTTVRAHSILVFGLFVLACSSNETESPQAKAGTVVSDYGTGRQTTPSSSGATSRVKTSTARGGSGQSETGTTPNPSLGGT